MNSNEDTCEALDVAIEAQKGSIERYREILNSNSHSRWYDLGRRNLESKIAELKHLETLRDSKPEISNNCAIAGELVDL